MERGGTAALQFSFQNAHPPSAVAYRPLLSRRQNSPRSTRGAPTRPQLLPGQLWCHSCFRRKHAPMHVVAQHSAAKAFSSNRPEETSLCGEEIQKDKFLIDCGADQECVIGGIVALGKFDALHIGHRELAIQASKAGTPFLLSFVGIGEVLGWEPRPPIVANCDRKRVLSSWAPYCGNEVPLEYSVQFSNVRHLTPRQFVERLSKDLKVSGVVAGANYRFGYKASGDASELVRLCKEYGLSAFIVSPVMDKTQRSYNGAFRWINTDDKGQVSSTRVRHALAIGAMDYVAELIGRKHRLVLSLHKHCCSQKGISIPKSSLLNQPPKDDAYINCTIVIDDKLVGPANVVIDVENINIELNDTSMDAEDLIHDHCFLGIEFD
ncbi:FAD synthetase, chloroplastic-like [Zingiber officinale]|nr:FAD synthetase, chloroplastic-like [Zingiber officinale]